MNIYNSFKMNIFYVQKLSTYYIYKNVSKELQIATSYFCHSCIYIHFYTD